MGETDSKQPAMIHWILDHPKLAGLLAAVALAVGFSPRASRLASGLCLVTATIFGIAMIIGIKEKKEWSNLFAGTCIVFFCIAMLLFGSWLTDVRMLAHPSPTVQSASLAPVPTPPPSNQKT